MESNNTSLENKIAKVATEAIGKSITESLCSYNGPLKTLCDEVINSHHEELKEIIDNEFSTLLNSDTFRDQLKLALNKKLASVLIGRMGGELESTINKLKADPTTRAKITIAIDNVIAGK